MRALWMSSLLMVALALPAAAQSNREIGEMRLYIQQLEAQVRNLTGENERLRFELRQAGVRGGAVTQPDTGGSGIVRGTINPLDNSSAERGVAPQDLGTLSVAPDGSVAQDDPLIAPDGAGADITTAGEMQPDRGIDQPVAGGAGAPLDLSVLAGGQSGLQPLPDAGGSDIQATGTLPAAGAQTGDIQAGAAGGASERQLTASITGSARDEYDLAYGYILTGDFALAEAHFRSWIGAFPSNRLADDARFWLAESQLRQGKHQDAASGFLDLHKRVPDSSKGADTLVKLGVALVGLGEKQAACATFSEVARKYPDATGATMSRVANEQQRAQC